MLEHTQAIREGCQVRRTLETVEGGRFLRIGVRGPQAGVVLAAELHAFYARYPPLTRMALTWYPHRGWIVALAVGATDTPAARARDQRWTPAEVSRLLATYAQGG